MNVLRQKNLKCVEWRVRKPSASTLVSDTFIFHDRKCHLEIFFGSWEFWTWNYTPSSLCFKSCRPLQSPVTVTVHVTKGSETLESRSKLLTGANQVIWTYSGGSLEDCLLVFDIIIYADPTLNPMIMPMCTESLSEDFGKLLENREYSDVVLKCGEEVFHGHRYILSARSAVFSAMFWKTKSGIVNIEDMEPNILDYFLRYVYSGKIGAVNMDTAIELYKVADKYAVPSLKRKCASLIETQLTEDVVCSVLLMADQYADPELSDAVMVFAANRGDFLKSDQWSAFSEEHQPLALNVYKKFVKK